MMFNDKVINPDHYLLEDGRQSADVIQQELTYEEYKGWLKGSARKYDFRKGKKQHINLDMANDFLSQLPKGNEALLRDDVFRQFTLWKQKVNADMSNNDEGKKEWFLERLVKFLSSK